MSWNCCGVHKKKNLQKQKKHGPFNFAVWGNMSFVVSLLHIMTNLQIALQVSSQTWLLATRSTLNQSLESLLPL